MEMSHEDIIDVYISWTQTRKWAINHAPAVYIFSMHITWAYAIGRGEEDKQNKRKAFLAQRHADMCLQSCIVFVPNNMDPVSEFKLSG